MSSGQLFGVIDSCLKGLSEKLEMLGQLYRAHPETEPILQPLESMQHRINLEEKMIRLRLGIDSGTVKRIRDYNPELLGGIPADELAERIIRELRACQEYCRTLEEYFKFFKLENVSQFYKHMRFDFYEFERKSVAMTGRAMSVLRTTDNSTEQSHDHLDRFSRAIALHPLYFILDSSLCKNRDPIRVAFDAVAGGVKVLQTRFKSLGNRKYLDLARKLHSICREKDCLLIINDRVDIALMSGADGVHVGADDFSVQEIRHISENLIIGRSARNVADAQQAQMDGADYIGTGAVFASTTKQTAPVIGLRGLEKVVRSVEIPVVGIGGIQEDNCASVLKTGAAGFCSIGPFRARRSVKNLAAEFKR
ncbi:thiamine phosphate synthase [bacterium]|nr:thiamine phosphate synthase [bacterium]